MLYNIYVADDIAVSRDPDGSGKSGGIVRLALENGRLAFVSFVKCDRPSYLLRGGDHISAILNSPFPGNGDSAVMTYSPTKDGSLIPIGSPISTRGSNGCCLCDFDGALFCANYDSGSVIRMPDRLVTHSGKGFSPERQEKPHTHCVAPTPDGKYLCVVDLGLDTVFIYTPALEPVSAARVPDGHGCRHIIFSRDGRYAYVENELASDVSVFSYADGKLKYIRTCAALPGDYSGESYGAEIRLSADGSRLYVSNRGFDSISVFAASGEKLSLLANISSHGRWPWDFILTNDEKYMVCANKKSGSLSVFEMRDGVPCFVSEYTGLSAPNAVICD